MYEEREELECVFVWWFRVYELLVFRCQILAPWESSTRVRVEVWE